MGRISSGRIGQWRNSKSCQRMNMTQDVFGSGHGRCEVWSITDVDCGATCAAQPDPNGPAVAALTPDSRKSRLFRRSVTAGAPFDVPFDLAAPLQGERDALAYHGPSCASTPAGQ